MIPHWGRLLLFYVANVGFDQALGTELILAFLAANLTVLALRLLGVL